SRGTAAFLPANAIALATGPCVSPAVLLPEAPSAIPVPARFRLACGKIFSGRAAKRIQPRTLSGCRTVGLYVSRLPFPDITAHKKSTRRDRLLPRIEERHAKIGKVFYVARHELQVVLDRGRGQEAIDDGERYALIQRLGRKDSPTCRDSLRHGQ